MAESYSIKDTDAPVTFVSDMASGHINGVANFTFVTAFWSLGAGGNSDMDMRITARLRMDLWCVQQLRDHCDLILKQNSVQPTVPTVRTEQEERPN